MNEIVAGDLAFKNHQMILACKKYITMGFWELSKHLKESKESGYYLQIIGDGTWKDYLSMPELGISEPYANKLITAYTVWHERFHIKKEEIENVDSEKLYIAAIHANDQNYLELLEKAKVLSRSDLMLEMKEIDGEDHKHEWVEEHYERCKFCNMRRKIT